MLMGITAHLPHQVDVKKRSLITRAFASCIPRPCQPRSINHFAPNPWVSLTVASVHVRRVLALYRTRMPSLSSLPIIST